MRLLPPFRIVDTQEAAQELLDQLMQQSEVAVDTETTGLSRWADYVVCWSVSFEEEGLPGGVNRYVISSRLLSFFRPFFESTIRKIFHNAPFDLCMLWNSGIQAVNGDIACTQVLDSLIDENRFGNHGLKECAWDYLNLRMREYKDIVGMALEEIEPTMDPADFKAISKLGMGEQSKHFPLTGVFGDYASEDTWATLILYKMFREIAQAEVLGLKSDGSAYTVWDLHESYFTRFNRTISNMCRRGWRINKEFLEFMIPALEYDIQQIDLTFNRAAIQWSIADGMPLWEYEWEVGKKHIRTEKVFPNGYINPGSDNQLRFLFFEVMELPSVKETDGGKSGIKRESVGEEVLTTLYKDHGCNFASLVLQRRAIQKALSTYLKGLSNAADNNNKIHSSLRVMGARTGRLSCSAPNLQNITRPDKDPYGLRQAFIADSGHVLIVADYSTLEMRILASLSGCPDLCGAINSGLDLHCWTAEQMFREYTYDELKYAKDNYHNMELSAEEREALAPLVLQRQIAKAIGFGIIYGRGPESLAQELDLEVKHDIGRREATEMAKGYINTYLDTYRGVRTYMSQVLDDCRAQEYVQTWLLRKRRLISINSPDGKARAQAERQTLNSIIQGTASDIVMIAMNTCEYDPFLLERNCEMLMQVHDELVFQVPEEFAEECEQRVRHNMETPFAGHFSVPLTVSSDRALNWADAK